MRRAALRAALAALCTAALCAAAAAAAAPPPQPQDAASVLGDSCGLLQGGDPCARNASVPTGAALAYRPVCTPRCCSYACGRFFPCSTCSAARCGETCIPLPVALDISYANASLCDLARAAGAPNATKAPPALGAAAARCPCLSKAAAFAAAFPDEPSRAKAAAVAAAGSVIDCLVSQGEGPQWGGRGGPGAQGARAPGVRGSPTFTHPPAHLLPLPPATPGFSVKNGSAAARAALLAAAPSDVILEAPPVDGAFYASIAVAAAGCAAGGTTCDALPQLFLNYFQTAVKQVGGSG
jgi:hypothetical protein